MTVAGFFSRLLLALERAQVPYMLTGSFASSAHGMPRATRDVDMVIAPTRSQLAALLQQFLPDAYYVSAEEAMDAFARQSQFNVIDLATGWKVDFMIRKDREFSRAEFERRRQLEVAGVRIYVASPEDVLLAKLEWAKLGGSERQIEDAAGIISSQGDTLDIPYVEHWVRELGLQEQWRAVQRSGR